MMVSTRLNRVVFALFASLLVVGVGCTKGDVGNQAAKGGAKGEETTGGGDYEAFNVGNFSSPTNIDNPWMPLKPGTRLTWEGTTIDDEGDSEPHRVVFTVTDLVQEISGVKTVVCWDEDYADGELVETELIFLAQDNDGTVWRLGEYPEEYEDGAFVDAPGWIHGIKESRAGIMMKAEQTLGEQSYSQGWAPSVSWTDRGVVREVGQTSTVPAGTYEDVLVIEESDRAEPDSKQLKYYARGVGNIRIGWGGAKVGDREDLQLIKFEQLNAEDLAAARAKALELDRRGRERSKDVYALLPSLTSASGGAVAAAPSASGGTTPSAAAGGTPGTEEFGLTQRELVQAIEKVEGLIAECMREQGFEYVAVDYLTVRRGMSADKSMPGLNEEEFIEQHGFGISTMYTGLAPQLVDGYSPARVGLGDRNVQVFTSLSPADQVAYNRALLGENTDATLAVALESEDFSRCGGCTLKAVAQVFQPEQLQATYYNPKDALINNDPRMKAALRKYADEMRTAGFDYSHPDEVEVDIRSRLTAITGGVSVPIEQMSPEQKEALKKLQEDELRVAKIAFDLQEDLFDPVEEQIEKEMYARDVK